MSITLQDSDDNYYLNNTTPGNRDMKQAVCLTKVDTFVYRPSLVLECATVKIYSGIQL